MEHIKKGMYFLLRSITYLNQVYTFSDKDNKEGWVNNDPRFKDYLVMCPKQYFAIGMDFLNMRKSLEEIFI